MINKKIGLVLIFAAVIFTVSACQKNSWNIGNELNSQSQDGLLGTVITISTYDKIPQNIFEECFDAVRSVDERMSVNIADSEVSRLNSSAGNPEIQVSEDTYGLIEKALSISRLSAGAFDISIGSVMRKWKIGSGFARLPEKEEIEAALPYVDYNKIHLKGNNKISLEKNMSIDLGGIAKGFACDKALEILKKRHVRHALLNFGDSSIYTLGTKPDGSPWRVGIRNPVLGEDGYICVVEIIDKSISTSGGYEHYFEKDGEIYHHILDPKTGYPAKNGLLSVTVITDHSADADALSKCFVLGLDDGLKLLEDIPDCEGVFITNQREIYTTSGLKGKLQITDASFTEREK